MVVNSFIIKVFFYFKVLAFMCIIVFGGSLKERANFVNDPNLSSYNIDPKFHKIWC